MLFRSFILITTFALLSFGFSAYAQETQPISQDDTSDMSTIIVVATSINRPTWNTEVQLPGNAETEYQELSYSSSDYRLFNNGSLYLLDYTDSLRVVDPAHPHRILMIETKVTCIESFSSEEPCGMNLEDTPVSAPTTEVQTLLSMVELMSIGKNIN